MASKYMEQLQSAHSKGFEDGMRSGVQLLADFICLTLHDPDVMGKNRVLNRSSLEKIFAHCSKLDDHFSKAFNPADVEADYARAEMDAALRDIYGEDTDPFEARYPYAKDIKYTKARKGWI